MGPVGVENRKSPYKWKQAAIGLKVTKGPNAHLAGRWMSYGIMEQIANKDNSSESEKSGSNMTGAQERKSVPVPSLLVRVEAAIKQEPEFGILRAKLLEHGGTEVVPPFGWNNDLRQYVIIRDPDLPALVDHGYLITGPVVCRSRGMEPNRCHQNIARLWLQKRKRDALVGIATGYCLSDDLWVQHSWGIRKESLLETLGERDKYFGIRLDGVDADVFAFKALGREQTNWPLFSAEFVIRVWAEMERRIATNAEPSV